jgi:hypothetical protein
LRTVAIESFIYPVFWSSLSEAKSNKCTNE